jgi:peptide/nickel transport system ATP-binding protein/oligopeptide transport system ATP-binding protein
VAHLTTVIRTRAGTIRPVADVSFSVRAGGTLGIVGESGSGKSLTALSIMRLLPDNAAIESGAVRFEGEDLARLPESRMRHLRGQAIGMVFQEPMTALNPVLPVGAQVAEAMTLHRLCPPREAAARAVEMLSLVGIPDPARRAADYPHQMSGGMRQRVMIAAALACRPRLLIADEPTTALDVTIQAQILELLRRLRAQLGGATVLITHDLGVIAEFVEEVVVMYAGGVVERADVKSLFHAPAHPYTEALLRSVPRVQAARRRLAQIPGSVPPPAALPPGCRFHPRCPEARPLCARFAPPEVALAPRHAASCWKLSGFEGPA